MHVAENLSAARCLWRPKLYDWILLDMRRYLPEEALAFYEQISEASPREHFAFLVGPPEVPVSLLAQRVQGSRKWEPAVERDRESPVGRCLKRSSDRPFTAQSPSATPEAKR